MTASARGRGGERGFTVVELLVTMAIMGVVIAVAGGAVISALQAQRRQIAEVDALNDAKIVLERATREIRGANPLVSAEEDRIVVEVTRDDEIRTTTYEVQASVAGRDCPCLVLEEERTSIATGASSDSTQVVLERLAFEGSETAFAYWDADGAAIPAGPSDPAVEPSDVQRVTIRLRTDLPETDETVHLVDDVMLRNQS